MKEDVRTCSKTEFLRGIIRHVISGRDRVNRSVEFDIETMLTGKVTSKMEDKIILEDLRLYIIFNRQQKVKTTNKLKTKS